MFGVRSNKSPLLFTRPPQSNGSTGPPRIHFLVTLHEKVHVQTHGLFTQSIRLLQVWDSLSSVHSPVLLITSPPPLHCLAQGGVRVVVVMAVAAMGESLFLLLELLMNTPPSTIFIHPFSGRHPSWTSWTQTCLLTWRMSNGAGKNSWKEHRFTHTHVTSTRPVNVAQPLTHIWSVLMPHCRSTSILFYCSRRPSMNQRFLAKDYNQ